MRTIIVSSRLVFGSERTRLDAEYYINNDPKRPKLTAEEIQAWERISADALKLRQLITELKDTSWRNYTALFPKLLRQIAVQRQKVGEEEPDFKLVYSMDMGYTSGTINRRFRRNLHSKRRCINAYPQKGSATHALARRRRNRNGPAGHHRKVHRV